MEVASAKPAAKKQEAKKAASGTKSPAFDPNDPFQQTWEDKVLPQGFSDVASNMKH